MSQQTVSILDGNAFLVTDRRGDVEASASEPLGLFNFDTRFLSKWVLTLDGDRPSVLSIENLHYFEVQHFLVPATGTVYVNRRSPSSAGSRSPRGFVERLVILNHSDQPKAMRVRIALDADFADLFEVKDVLTKKGELYRREESRPTRARISPRPVRARNPHPQRRPCRDRRRGSDLSGRDSPHGEWSTRLVVEGYTQATAAAAPGDGSQDPGDPPHGAAARTSSAGRRAPPCCAAPGARWSGRTSAASRTWRRSGSFRHWPGEQPSPPPGCPGSWRCSAGTA